MGICCANFTPISNHCARKRAPLCPLAKSYQPFLLFASLVKNKFMLWEIRICTIDNYVDSLAFSPTLGETPLIAIDAGYFLIKVDIYEYNLLYDFLSTEYV